MSRRLRRNFELSLSLCFPLQRYLRRLVLPLPTSLAARVRLVAATSAARTAKGALIRASLPVALQVPFLSKRPNLKKPGWITSDPAPH